MFSLKSQRQYEHVSTSDDSSSASLLEKGQLKSTPSFLKSNSLRIIGYILAALAVVFGSFTLGFLTSQNLGKSRTTDPSNLTTPSTHVNITTNCTDPYFRKEWRSLSDVEKKEYLDAFQCFVDSPSIIGMNGSLYDDFSWVHNLVAHSTHTQAPFLTWHRRFIWVYEQQLRKTCGYQGALPYWDWSLDWEDLPASPIFSSSLGFGGNGDPKAPVHQSAHCVTDLPIQNFKPKWYGETYDPHCLARMFETDWLGHYLNPESLEDVMASQTYKDFFLALEMKAHDIIPLGIRGDFTSFTAPNDPIFYLHHSQLDRVWWLWQLRDKKNRVHNYGGEGLDGANVTLDDVIPLAGLAKDVKVSEIMDTEGGEMCYRYMYS